MPDEQRAIVKKSSTCEQPNALIDLLTASETGRKTGYREK
jgi:hypothetical protein